MNDSQWKILTVDDDEDVVKLTQIALSKFTLNGKKLQILGATSGKQAEIIMRSNPDIAMVLLDVVMEDVNAGLNLVNYIRKELNNPFVRIILRTGQVFEAPPTTIVREYDINDYVHKSDLTSERLNIIVINALKSYNEIVQNYRNTILVRKIIQGMRDLFGLEDSSDTSKNVSLNLEDHNAKKMTDYILELEKLLGFTQN